MNPCKLNWSNTAGLWVLWLTAGSSQTLMVDCHLLSSTLRILNWTYRLWSWCLLVSIRASNKAFCKEQLIQEVCALLYSVPCRFRFSLLTKASWSCFKYGMALNMALNMVNVCVGVFFNIFLYFYIWSNLTKILQKKKQTKKDLFWKFTYRCKWWLLKYSIKSS